MPVKKIASVKTKSSKKGDPITVGPFAKKADDKNYVKSETQTRRVGTGKTAVKEPRIFRSPDAPLTKEEREAATKKQRAERNAGLRTPLDFKRGQDSLVTERESNKIQAKGNRAFAVRQVVNKVKNACTPKGKGMKAETRSRSCSKPGKGF